MDNSPRENLPAVRPAALTELDAACELLQSGFWGYFRERSGWRAFPFVIGEGGPAAGGEECPSPLLVLCRRLAPGAVLGYVPLGPGVPEPPDKRAYLSGLGRRLRPHLPRGTFVLRFDPPWSRAGLGRFPDPPEVGGRLRKSRTEIQPASTVILDLAQGEDAVLKGMKSKTRYNVRLSARRGVQVEDGEWEKLDAWYTLHRETAVRDRIAVRSSAYFAGLFEAAGSYPGLRPELRILLARADGELLGGIIVCFWGGRAWYLYGASSGRRRNLMATYALQWRAVRMAVERGCREYDLFGIPPSDDPSHPMAGLFQFKTGFGGRIVNRLGCYDVVYRPAVHRAYAAAEALRRFYFKTLKKRTGL